MPIRELFVIVALKGGAYSPAWGFSSGIAPSFRGRAFHRQSTDKNAVFDLIIDPIDITGNVPSQAFHFITGYDPQVPGAQIRACAEHFVPLALCDFERVQSLRDFCEFFLQRSRLPYQRFGFDSYIQHQLVYGFVLIMTAQRNEGMEMIREFCRSTDTEFDDRILTDCIRHSESCSATA